MYTIEKSLLMPRKKKEEPSLAFQLRLAGEEAERWLEIKRRATNRNPRCNDTHINRRLLGLDPDTDGLVTDKDRLYFQGSKAGSRAEMLGRIDAKPHIAEVSPKTRRK